MTRVYPGWPGTLASMTRNSPLRQRQAASAQSGQAVVVCMRGLAWSGGPLDLKEQLAQRHPGFGRAHEALAHRERVDLEFPHSRYVVAAEHSAFGHNAFAVRAAREQVPGGVQRWLECAQVEVVEIGRAACRE